MFIKGVLLLNVVKHCCLFQHAQFYNRCPICLLPEHVSHAQRLIIKGPIHSFVEEIQTQNFNMYNINAVTQKYLSFTSLSQQAVLRGEEGPRTLFEAREVAGSATYKQSKIKQYKLCFPLRSVCLFSHENKESCLFSLLRPKKDLSLLINIS